MTVHSIVSSCSARCWGAAHQSRSLLAVRESVKSVRADKTTQYSPRLADCWERSSSCRAAQSQDPVRALVTALSGFRDLQGDLQHTRATLRRMATWLREAKEVGVQVPVLLDLQVPCLTGAASDLQGVAALAWDRTLDLGPSDPSDLRDLVVESFWDPFLVVLGWNEMLDRERDTN